MRNARESDFAAEEVDVLGAALAHPQAGGDDFLQHVFIIGWFLRTDATRKQEHRRDGGSEKSTKQTMVAGHRPSRSGRIGARCLR
jgi:hypothetical protein